MDYITDKKKIGENLQRIRKKKYKTQESFAEALGLLDRKTISKWETGETEIPMTRLPEICNLLDCDMDYLFGKIDVPRKNTEIAMKETGLSEKSITKLNEIMKSCHLDWWSLVFNEFIENEKFAAFLGYLSLYATHKSEKITHSYYRIDTKDIAFTRAQNAFVEIASEIETVMTKKAKTNGDYRGYLLIADTAYKEGKITKDEYQKEIAKCYEGWQVNGNDK